MDEYLSKYFSVSNDLNKSQERFDEAKKQYEEIFDLNKKAIEQSRDLDGSIENNLNNWKSLSDTQKESLRGAIDEVENLIEKMDMLDKEHYVNLHILEYRSHKQEKPDMSGEYTLFNNKEENHAKGGILTKPHLGLVAEAGPEAIIPLSGSNRECVKQLWLQSGHILGTIQEHATGGIFGNTNYKCYVTKQDTEPLQNNTISDIKAPMSINLGGINITIEGNADPSDGKSIVKSIKEQMPTITNDLCEQMSNMLNKVFSNMTMEAE